MLSDPRAVVDCVPGVKLGDRLEDGSYDATVTVKFGRYALRFSVEAGGKSDAIEDRLLSFEGCFDLDQLDVELPELSRLSARQIGA